MKKQTKTQQNASENSRAIAALVLDKVIQQGKSLRNVLPHYLEQAKPADHAFIQELCYGCLRWHLRLHYLATQLLEKPIKEMDGYVAALLFIGLYQIIYLNTPEYAAVSATIDAAKTLKKDWAAKLINGVLRQFLRDKEALIKKADKNEVARYAHPKWMIKAWKKAWPDHWRTILSENNERPPFCLRVNQQQISREDYLAELKKCDMEAFPLPDNSHGIYLPQAMPASQLPGFEQGQISVQDGAPQLAAELLDLQAGQSVLDACAAPGGKTTHILETESKLAKLVAIDKDAKRLQRLQENLDRLHFTATVKCADIQDTKSWWDGNPFDRILLDAPCSATGVIRRHPDIKILRTEKDIAKLARLQLQLLTALWPLLKPNGMLVYATCSLFPTENEQVIHTFLSQETTALLEPITTTWGHKTGAGQQIFPQIHSMDGFYYAKFRKNKEAT